jgi:hypothetical protein
VDDRHPTPEQLIGFVRGHAEEAEVESMYRHLAECEVCTQRQQVIRLLHKDFDGSWDEFLDEVRAHLEARESEVAERSAAQSPGLELSIRGILDGTRRLASAVATALLDPARPGRLTGALAPAHGGVGDAQPHAARELIEAASDCCARGDHDGAIASLIKAAGSDPAAVDSVTIDLLAGERNVGVVVVQASDRSITVLVHPDRVGSRRCLATLNAEHDDRALQTRLQLQPVEGADYLLAEFRDVPDGPFTIRLELPGN